MKKKIDVNPCFYCKGEAELKQERSHYAHTSEGMRQGRKFFVRCSKCKARTQAFIDPKKAISSWVVGNVFQVVHSVDNSFDGQKIDNLKSFCL